MQSGLGDGGGGSGGGLPEYYAAAQGRFPARSINGATMNMNNNIQQGQYRTQHGLFVDPNGQITQRIGGNLIGKRPHNEYQALQQQQQNQALFLRSVKQRMLNNQAFSANLMMQQQQQQQPNSSAFSSLLQQRYGFPLLQSLRQQQPQQKIPLNGVPFLNNVNNNNNVNVNSNNMQKSHVLSSQFQSSNNQDSPEQKMMTQLQELEKELLLDDLEDENDAVSVITNANSEWSQSIQNLFSSNDSVSLIPNGNGISQSPTSSSATSSRMASSVTSPPPKSAFLEAAAAISDGKTESVTEILSKLSTTTTQLPNSQQKLAESMVIAFKSRCDNSNKSDKVAELFTQEHFEATQMLYSHSPCFKLGFLAANLAILETAIKESQNGFKKIHVIDFDIGHGNQYVNFIHALSSKQQNGSQQQQPQPFTVKITSVAGAESFSEERLKLVGESLSQHAEKVGIFFSFKLLSQKVMMSELTRDSLGCEDDEVLAVNFAFKLCKLPDESVSIDNPRDALLRSVKALSPSIVTIVEQEMNTNTAPFVARVNDTFGYYSALFDSIESTVPSQSSERVKVEAGLSRRLVNSVACEGADRVERCEVFGKWSARLSMAGFALKPLSQNIAESMRAKLASSSGVNPGFTIHEEKGGVGFGWMGRTITIASAWC